MGGIGEGNQIQSNGDDGIAITATNTTGTVSRPIVTIVENTIGGENNGVAVGNVGDGVSMNIFGQSLIGTGTATAGVQGNGPIVQLTMTDNIITNSGQRGVNLLMHGAAGERDRENGASLLDPVRLVLTGNTVSSNGTQGIYFRGDSDTLQNRVVSLVNPPNGMGGFINNINFDPTRPEFTNLNGGSVNGNTAYQSPYLNLRTVQNTLLTVTGNSVQNNGVGTVTGEGLFIEVGTGSYLAADVRNNQFGGNLEEDFHTESFLSAGETALSLDVNNALFDRVPLDDTAQLDLRFSNNSGNQIDVTAVGATYTQVDPVKLPFAGATRDAFLFQIDDGGNLDNPNNTFINFGITQNIDGAFTTGQFNLRAAADPLFPNIGFAPFLP